MITNLENISLCGKCRDRVPCEFFIRDGGVWIRKDCPRCGQTESLVSNDAVAWQKKRELWNYIDENPSPCSMHCDTCSRDHKPNMVFIDITNRCNMHCPICIATNDDMGFDFNPPIEYFDKIFADIAKMNPKPEVQFFGGEPTVRKDLFELIDLARKYGLRVFIVTNGQRIADEKYCRKLCKTDVSLRFSFDGVDPEIYQRMRKNRPAGVKKLKALENLKKYSRRKITLSSCFAKGINEKDMPEYFKYCHENRDLIGKVGLIPLTENWEEGKFDVSQRTTLEDIEKMVSDCVKGGDVEFIPAGMTEAFRLPRSFFPHNPQSDTMLFAGVHPSCETFTLLVSDGKQWRSINNYLKKSFTQSALDFNAVVDKISPKLRKLDPKKRFQRFRGQMICLRAFIPWLLRTVRSGLILSTLFKAVGKKFSRSKCPKGRRPRKMLRVAALPFEEQDSIDARRLEHCKAVFAYEDTDDGEVKYLPACIGVSYRDTILRKIAEKYDNQNDGKAEEADAVLLYN